MPPAWWLGGLIAFAVLPVHGETAAQTGQRLYERNCLACHGADGMGAMPGVPDFTERNGVLRKPDAVLLRNTINGMARPGTMAMPARGGNPALTDDELRAALAHIRRAFGASATMEKRNR